ncbi:CBS domain-containing protein [Streptomyces sp. CC210A]|uniref:CBS domain-containing protein n=1 Tax=Streptomyces sp. CC210A TaxID=2898184 RepID=UPI001F2A0E12|nr:CBS domain-containing protein [Streptomyces sp. CC210A]
MQHRTVSDVMTHHVVSVRPDTPFKEVAQLLAAYDITAMPVVDARDRPVGVVSEGDLLRKPASLPDPAGRAAGARPLPREQERADAEDAGALMSAPAVTARPDWNVVETARVMARHGVKRLPVVDGTGRLVGIVSRADLLRPFLRSDTAIREEIDREVLGDTLGLARAAVRTEVRDGVVTLTGRVADRAQLVLVERLCRSVDGVVAVHARLACAQDAPATPQPHQG